MRAVTGRSRLRYSPVPVPDRRTVTVPPLLVTVIWAERSPAVIGLNPNWKPQLVPPAMAWPEPGFGQVNPTSGNSVVLEFEMVETSTDAVPIADNVSVVLTC